MKNIIKRLGYWLFQRGKQCRSCCLWCKYYDDCSWEVLGKAKRRKAKRRVRNMYIIAKERGQQVREIILQCIIHYIEEHGYPPSIREICDITEIKSTATVHHHITGMLESGMLETDCGWGAPRALRVPGYRFVKAD